MQSSPASVETHLEKEVVLGFLAQPNLVLFIGSHGKE